MQVSGLPIGPRATSAIARIVMNKQDELMFKELARLGVRTELVVRYVDDVRQILEALAAGTVIRDGHLTIDDEQTRVDEELEDPESEVTARILKEVYNNLMDGIVFMTEVRGDFPDEWGIPTLDCAWKMVGGGGRQGKKVFRIQILQEAHKFKVGNPT